MATAACMGWRSYPSRSGRANVGRDRVACAAMSVSPACALYGQCGGCQLQHLVYDDQLAHKTEEIRRLYPDGDVEVSPCVPSPAPYGYRSKLTPHFPRPRPDRTPTI